MFGPGRRTLAWLTAALAGLATALPSIAAPDTPAVGSYRTLVGFVRLAGADGALWQLGMWASTSDVAVNEDHSVYVDLARCPGFVERCSRAGGWRVALPANAIQVASDLSSASLRMSLGGFPIAMTLHATGPGDPVLPAYPDLSTRQTDVPANTPSAVAQVTQVNHAAGTVAFAGSTCPAAAAVIGSFTGADTSGHAGMPTFGTYSDSPVPAGIDRGLAHGPYGRPYCLGPNGAPNAGQRIAAPAGSYAGRFTVPAGGSVDVNASVINVDDPNDNAVAVMMVKKVGQPELSYQQTLERQGTVLNELYGGPYLGQSNRVATLTRGTYEFALVSTNGVSAHLFATKHLRVSSLRRDSRWQLARQIVNQPAALQQKTATITHPFTKTSNTFGVLVGTYTDWANAVPPVDSYEILQCFRLRGHTCGDSYEMWSSTGQDFGYVYGWGFDAPSESVTAEMCFGFLGTIANGSAESFMQLTATGSKGTMDLMTVTGPFA